MHRKKSELLPSVWDRHAEYVYVTSLGIPVCVKSKPGVSRQLQSNFISDVYCTSGDGRYRICDKNVSGKCQEHYTEISCKKNRANSSSNFNTKLPECLVISKPTGIEPETGTCNLLPPIAWKAKQLATGNTSTSRFNEAMHSKKRPKNSSLNISSGVTKPCADGNARDELTCMNIYKKSDWPTSDKLKELWDETKTVSNRATCKLLSAIPSSAFDEDCVSGYTIADEPADTGGLNEDEDEEKDVDSKTNEDTKHPNDGDGATQCLTQMKEVSDMETVLQNMIESDNERPTYEDILELYGWRAEIPGDPLHLKPIHHRLPYYKRMPPQALEAPYPSVHYSFQSPFFLNTIPMLRYSFVIHPDFVSESLERRRELEPTKRHYYIK